MGSDRLLLILQAAAGVILGGGFWKLLDFWYKRRAELRKINTASDVDTSTVTVNQAQAYQMQVKGLLEDIAALREQARDMQAKVDRLEARGEQERHALTEQLQIANTENARLATRNAQLQSDLLIAQRQYDELQRRRS